MALSPSRSRHCSPGWRPRNTDQHWLTTNAIPGFRFEAKITSGQSEIWGEKVNDCIVNTICISGAIAGQPEIFARMPGPKGNGYLWPTIVKFNTSRVDIWIEQITTSIVKHYVLEGASPGNDVLPGLFDRTGFTP